MSMSSDDSDDGGGPMRGFVWGNVNQEWRLDEQDLDKYPQEFHENMETQQVSDVSAGVSRSVLEAQSASSQEAVAAAPVAPAASTKLLNADDRALATQIRLMGRASEESDEEDFDAEDENEGGALNVDDDVVNVEELVEPLPKSASPIKLSELDVPDLHVLRIDEDGNEVLRFSDLFASRMHAFSVGLKRSESIPALVPMPVALEGTSWYRESDTERFLAQPLDRNEEVVLSEKSALLLPLDELTPGWGVFPCGNTLLEEKSANLRLIERLETSSFSLLEQISWEDDIEWDGAGPELQASDDEQDRASVSSMPLVDTALNADELMLDDVKETKEVNVTMMDPDRAKLRLRITKARRPRRPFVRPAPLLPPQQQEVSVWGGMHHPMVKAPAPAEDALVSPFGRNFDFDEMEWLDSVAWDGRPNTEPVTALILDLNDDSMLFGDESLSKQQRDGGAIFNLSNDEVEMYRKAGEAIGAIVGKAAVQHAVFAQQLERVAFPTHMSSEEWRNFHRPPAVFSEPVSLRLSSKERSRTLNQERKHVPKKLSELSGREGRLILTENIEQFPPLMMNVGMASEFVTYYRRLNADDNTQIEPHDGTTRILKPEKDDESPFIADVKPGRAVSSLNNNMFSVPLFEHQASKTDFLLTQSRSRPVWYIRDIPALYTLGQVQPKLDVKAPNSRAANTMLKDMLSALIFRMLKRQPRLQISDVFDAFPNQSETSIRAKLKEVAEFQRGGFESGWWKRKPNTPIPSDTQIKEMVTPEHMCLYAIMRAGQQRLEDAGIEELLNATGQLSAVISKLSDQHPIKKQAEQIEMNLQLTPWNLTANFLAALQGRCLLKLDGPGNPLGSGQGFSYVKAPHRMEADPAVPKIAPAKALTGTDKDLRKLNMTELRDALMYFDISESYIKTKTRWQQVGLLRQLSSEATLNGEQTAFGRFARQQRNTNRVQQLQFLKEAQKVFDRQCEVLSQVQRPDDEHISSAEEMADFAKGLEDIMNGPSSGMPPAPAAHVRREQDERAEFERFMKEQQQRSSQRDEGCSRTPAATELKPEESPSSTPGRKAAPSSLKRKERRKVLRKTVTLTKADGEQSIRVIRIVDPRLIEAYELDQKDGGSRLKELDTTVAPSLSHEERPKIFRKRGEVKKRRRKRKTGDALTPLKAGGTTTTTAAKSLAVKAKGPRGTSVRNRTPVLGPNGKPLIRCGACGTHGHTKSNRKCPAHPESRGVLKAGTSSTPKIVLSAVARPSPNEGEPKRRHSTPAKRRRDVDHDDVEELEDLIEHDVKRRASFRRRGDPRVKLNSLLQCTLEAMQSVPGASLFVNAVTDEIAPGYSARVSRPMYLQLLRSRTRDLHYRSAAEFREDVELLVTNSTAYNGPGHPITVAAGGVVKAALNELKRIEHEICDVEAEIRAGEKRSRALEDMRAVLDELWRSETATFFRFKVKKSELKDYYEKIKNPIALSCMREKIERREYDNIEAFRTDLDLLLSNAVSYNGAESPVAMHARTLHQLALQQLATRAQN